MPISTISKTVASACTEATIQESQNSIRNTSLELLSSSKEKYKLKEKLILESQELTLQEKLYALDISFQTHCFEAWLSCIVTASICVGVTFIICYNSEVTSRKVPNG